MPELKIYAGGLALALIACVSVTAEAKAACNVIPNNLSAEQEAWPGNASHRALRKAYRSGRCVIIKGLHEGGDPCGDGVGTNHITVDVISGNTVDRTYHVFDYTEQVGGVTRQCST